ncbi:MAG: preprotein translocase subunit YajC [Prevotella sp.]|nr:preprotein translocase subunit YajC [Prevotella sp.]
MGSSNVVSYILIGVMLVGLFALMFVQGRRQKKAQADYVAMLDTLRPGVKVKMASGLLGRIKEIREEAPGFKTITINVGEDKNVVEMTFVIEAVQGIVNEEAINKLNLEKTVDATEGATAPETENVETKINGEPISASTSKSTKKSTSKRK